MAALELDLCHGRVFLDGGSNTGDSVRAFLGGHFYNCALNSPYRLYSKAWRALDARARRAAMAPLHAPHSFCIRSFEANPRLVPLLRAGAPPPGAATAAAAAAAGADSASTAAAAPNVRNIDAALSNRSGTGLPRAVVTYARNPWGSSATTLPFGDVHPGNKPSALSTETVRVLCEYSE